MSTINPNGLELKTGQFATGRDYGTDQVIVYRRAEDAVTVEFDDPARGISGTVEVPDPLDRPDLERRILAEYDKGNFMPLGPKH